MPYTQGNKFLSTPKQKPASPWGNFSGGSDIYQMLMDQIKNGLDPKQRAMLESQAGGAIRGGEQAINESFAGSGGSIGSKLAGLTSLRSNVNRNLQETLLGGDTAAKQSGIQNLFTGTGVTHGIDQFNQEMGLKKKILADQPSGFEQMMGQFLSGAGGAAGTAASTTCFCYAEAFGSSSREFIKARNWSINASDRAKRGYMKLSSLLIPIMRRSPKFKKWFRKFASHVLKGMGEPNISFIVMYKVCELMGGLKLTDSEVNTLNTVFNG